MQTQSQFLAQDGTSQAGRMRKALDPDSIAVDERSPRDLLAFAQKFARELRYINEQNQADGDWSAFLGDADLDELAAFLIDPAQFDSQPEKKARFSRPHLALFLTFLQLLQNARAQLNSLTRRHLEFYYREALALTSRKAQPDQVHLLVELADQQEQFLLPAGTLFDAGPDASGQAVFFRSDEDLLASQASVASVKSLFAQRKVIGIREARQSPDTLIELIPANHDVLAEGKLAERSFLAMLMMALGAPVPGSRLEPYPGPRAVDAALLAELDTLLAFVPNVLYMPFSTFRSLMQLKAVQETASQPWSQVNASLEAAARARLKDPAFVLDRSEPANFEKNLLAALGRSQFGDLFNELPDVDDIYGVYRRREREDVIEFIQSTLFMAPGDFAAMMAIVEEINGRWRQVYEILRSAGRKKQRAHPEHQLQPPQIRTYVTDKFNDLVQRTLGAIDYSSIQGARPASFDECHARILVLEDYFHMPAENFVLIRQLNAGQEDTRPWEWEQLYAILEEAHNLKAIADRRAALKALNETQGFQAMLLYALGDPNPGDALPLSRVFDQLDAVKDRDYLVSDLFLDPANFSYLLSVLAKGKRAAAEEWANAYIILELAQRRKRNWTVPPARIENWQNLYVASDARQVQVRLSTEAEGVTPRWRTFGAGFAATPGAAQTQPGTIGFAISSPQLALAEGKRSITLTIEFEESAFDRDALALAIQDTSPFQVSLSSGSEMVACQNVSLRLLPALTRLPGASEAYQRALQFTILLDEQAPAVEPLAAGPGIRAPWPVLQLALADLPPAEGAGSGPQKRYAAFQNLALKKIHLKTDVAGLSGLLLQNDSGPLDPQKPFEPFGLSPVVGSSFALAHRELSCKKLDQLSFAIEWLNAPDNFSSYYLGYLKSEEREITPANNLATSPIANNTSFSARLKLYDNRSLFAIGSLPLFNADPKNPSIGASQPSQATIAGSAISAALPTYQRALAPTQPASLLDWRRYWKLELLGPDFQHSAYPRAAAGCASKIVPGSSSDPKPQPYAINAPYTPAIKSLRLGYSSALEIDPSGDDFSQQPDHLYHVEPFGFRDLSAGPAQPFSFLPQFENEGELYIGIHNLKPPQSLALLFQMAEGSADPSLERQPVRWSYLDGSSWASLEEGQLLADSTQGLLNSGILQFNLPPAASGSLLPPDAYWLRAGIPASSRSVADTIAIHTQALRATFADQNNDPQRLAQPLPADSIHSLAEPLPQVQAVHQPYSSFGGKRPDQASSFYTRVSERLRHKNRALTAWDYEHLVLEAFPSIYKVKCLPVGTAEDPRLADVVQVIVIPDIQGKLPFDPFEPRLPADVLAQIEAYLLQHAPALAQVQVKNPTYVRLKTRLGVRLRADGNPGYFKSLLNEELQRYLAPWAYDRSAEIVFGGRINASLIVNFLESRPYVDYVAGIKLFTSLDGQPYEPYETSGVAQLGEVSALAPDAILVSDRAHEIDLIAEEGYEQEYFTGINYMKIELDFQIAAG